MTGEWTKMRIALFRDPKVISMAGALRDDPAFVEWMIPRHGGVTDSSLVSDAALRCVTVALLLRVWGSAREFGRFVGPDLILRPCQISHLDQMAETPGIGKAMADVEWARCDEALRSVTLVNFMEWNPPMDGAERMRLHRNRHSPVTQRDDNVTHRPSQVRHKSVTNPLPDGDGDEDSLSVSHAAAERERVRSVSPDPEPEAPRADPPRGAPEPVQPPPPQDPPWASGVARWNALVGDLGPPWAHCPRLAPELGRLLVRLEAARPVLWDRIEQELQAYAPPKDQPQRRPTLHWLLQGDGEALEQLLAGQFRGSAAGSRATPAEPSPRARLIASVRQVPSTVHVEHEGQRWWVDGSVLRTSEGALPLNSASPALLEAFASVAHEGNGQAGRRPA